MSEVELVEVAKPEDNEKNERCSQPLGEDQLIRNEFSIWIFLKRNAFVILTMAAVAVGKKSSVLCCIFSCICFFKLFLCWKTVYMFVFLRDWTGLCSATR